MVEMRWLEIERGFINKETGEKKVCEAVRTLQYRNVEMSGGYQIWEDWQTVPVVQASTGEQK
jgi:hypothetical protein